MAAIQVKLSWLKCPARSPRWVLGNLECILLHLNAYFGPADQMERPVQTFGENNTWFLSWTLRVYRVRSAKNEECKADVSHTGCHHFAVRVLLRVALVKAN